MTAVNIFVEHDHARIYTDGAIWDDKGAIQGFMPKVLPAPHMDGVLVNAGRPEVGLLALGLAADIGGGFDDVVYAMSDAIRKVKSHFAKSAFWLVGFSEKAGCMRAYLWSHESVNGLPPFTRIPVEEIVMPVPMDTSLADGKDPVALLESQRKNLHATPAFSGSAVGGFIQETIVAKEGSKTRIIHRWPDKVGKKIAA